MGLTWAPTHFWFVVESVLSSVQGSHPLSIVIYLDDIAMYGDSKEQVLQDTLEAIKQLYSANFMLKLHMSQLVYATAQDFGHLWTLGGFWVPNVTNFTALMEKVDGKLA